MGVLMLPFHHPSCFNVVLIAICVLAFDPDTQACPLLMGSFHVWVLFLRAWIQIPAPPSPARGLGQNA